MMSWIEDFFTRGGKRISAAVLLIGTVSLSACALILSVAGAKGKDVAPSLIPVCGALGVVVGYAYGVNKKNEGEK